jgi:membrane protein
VAIAAWRRYEAVDGPLQSALLALYILVAVVPALLVMAEYLDAHPAALANHIAHHYGLSAATASLVRGVLVQDRQHELGSALLAIAGALFFGLGFGRVLQLVHVRAWGLPTPSRQTDQGRYAVVLLGLYGLILLLLVQLSGLAGAPSWARFAVTPGWVALVALYFAWAARVLTHQLIGWRGLLPGALLTAVGLVLLMWISRFVMEAWLNFYARDYGGFGVVMAIFFWIVFSSVVIVAAASLGPALAERRTIRGSS